MNETAKTFNKRKVSSKNLILGTLEEKKAIHIVDGNQKKNKREYKGNHSQSPLFIIILRNNCI